MSELGAITSEALLSLSRDMNQLLDSCYEAIRALKKGEDLLVEHLDILEKRLTVLERRSEMRFNASDNGSVIRLKPMDPTDGAV